jgi:hypothetical protein
MPSIIYTTATTDFVSAAKPATGWLSEPRPSPNAVEALYFDVRNAGDTSVIDAIRANVRTPGIVMHVYYTIQGLKSDTPKNATQYDHFLWTPIHTTYALTGASSVFVLPTAIRAAFIKLEFSNLQPRPFRIPDHPHLPAIQYRRYPTWIETQFEDRTIRTAVNKWFRDNRDKIKKYDWIQNIKDPVVEFQYKEREFLFALATDQTIKRDEANSLLINRKTNTYLDPVTLSKIEVSTNKKYTLPLTLSVDRNSILGEIVASDTPQLLSQTQRESGFTFSISDANTAPVGSIDDTFAHMAQVPMWFNRVCRHIYAYDEARFGRVAYFAGLDTVQFLRKDLSIARDEDIVTENLHDFQNLESNNWVIEQPSVLYNIVNGGSVVDLVADYTIDGVTVTGEQFFLANVTDTYAFGLPGHTPAVDVHIYEDRNPQGSPDRGIEYTIGRDYDLSLVHINSGTDAGLSSTILGLNVLSERLVAEPTGT